MASPPLTAAQGLNRGTLTDTYGSTSSRNAAACEAAPVQSPHHSNASGPSDSKRNSAAQLAQELASSTSWSDVFLPHPSRTVSQHPASDTPNIDHMNSVAAQIEQDTDPPPAYSRAPDPNHSPSETQPSVQMDSSPSPAHEDSVDVEAQQTSQPHMSEFREDQVVVEHRASAETPLLGRRVPRHKGGRCWQWIQKAKTRKRRCCRLLGAVLFFSILAAVLTCIFVDDHNGGSLFFRRPAEFTKPLVPTGPDYRRHEATDDITGAYKLYDHLELTTSTGIIDIEIEPQEGDHPAILILSTDFGSINLQVSPRYLKQRNPVKRPIYTEIRSLTGSVAAQILLGHGGNTLVDTSTGIQDLCVLTSGIGSNDAVSNITTLSKTGIQKIALKSLERGHKPISNLRAEHHATGFASLDITYPSEWVGEIRAVAAPFGVVRVSGKDLEYTQEDQDTIVAHRGSSQKRNLVKVISEGTGSSTFKC